MRSSREIPGQLVRFALVGVSNTVLSYAVYAALVTLAVPYVLAGAVAFAAGAVNGYRLNRRWTFGRCDSAGLRVRYVLVQACGLLATSLLLRLFVERAQLGRIGSYGLAIPLVTLATFAANRWWAFSECGGLPRHAPLAR